ncbi:MULTISPECIES: hydrogenase maturation protease [Streptomyces]|uniref:hydrogenase maturation protease n=1 Tax=Streptomyces lavendulae TaxID=1914 RepID=UPI0009965450
MVGLRALVRRPALGTAPYAVCPAAQDLVPLAGQAVPGDARTRKWVPVKPLAGTAVIGIGNEFRRDDGLGWAAIALLRARKAQRALPPGTELAQCDGDPGRLISIWEGKALTFVVDACFPPAAQPGRTHRWCVSPGGMPHPAAAGRQSTHGLGLAEAVCLADRVGRGPGRLIVYAVEGADRSLGTGLTPAVAAALPLLTLRIEADVRRHDERTRRTGFEPRSREV